MARITAEGLELKLAQTEHTITVKLGNTYVLANGLRAVAHFWDRKDGLPSVMMILIPEDRYLSGRGLEVAGFNCGDDDVFGQEGVSEVEESRREGASPD